MSIKGLNDLMKQAGALQEKMQALQDELARLEVTGESGAGLVKVTMTGRHEVRRVAIDPGVATDAGDDSGREVLEDLIAAACNDAVRRLEAEQKSRMGSMAGAFGLPLDGLIR